LVEILIFSLIVSQALLISTSVPKFSKAANLFQISTRYCSLPSISSNFLRLNLSIWINLLTNPNPVYGHSKLCQYNYYKLKDIINHEGGMVSNIVMFILVMWNERDGSNIERKHTHMQTYRQQADIVSLLPSLRRETKLKV
jgi:type IV secretory pathway TraG/TraD family ATPase VirD4